MATLDPVALAALPIGTVNAQAFARNAGDIDSVVNGAGVVASRTGKPLLSLDEAMRRIGYESPVAFATGIVVNRSTQTVTNGGLTYHANPTQIPFTTSGTFVAAQWMLVSNISAQDLASTALGKGAALIGLHDAASRWAAVNLEQLAGEVYDAFRLQGITLAPGAAAANNTSIASAIAALNAAGGGVLQLAPGTWDLQGVIAATISAQIMVRLLPGAHLVRISDGGVFDISLSGGVARFVLDGHGLITASFGAPSTSSALKITGNSSPRGLVVSGNIWIRSGTGSWAYGIECSGVQDPDLSGLLISGDGQPGNNMSGVRIISAAGASVSWSIRGLDCYNVLYGIRVDSTTTPGVEGLKIIDCDFVDVKHGLWFSNTSSYATPQIEFIGCHVNSWNSCVKVQKAIQVSVVAGLFYRYSRSGGTFSEGNFFEVDGVQDFSIAGGTKMSVITAGVDIDGVGVSSSSQSSAFIRINDCHFWNASGTKSVLKITGAIYQVAIGSACTKSTTGKWVDTSSITSGIESIRLSQDLALVASDYAGTVMTDCAFVGGVVDVSGALWGRANVTGAASGGVITAINGTSPGRTYIIKSDVAGVILQHGSGINLRGSANITFGAGDTVTLYADVFTLREIARRGA